MKHPAQILAAAAVALCCAAFLALSQNSIPSSPSLNTADGGSFATYTVREYDGRIAVFFEGSKQPMMIYDVYVAELPDADAALLKNGLTTQTQAELQSIIEDYTS